MRIVSLEPFLTDTLERLGAGEQIVGISSDHGELPASINALRLPAANSAVDREFCSAGVALKELCALAPDIVVTRLTDGDRRAALEQSLEAAAGRPIRLRHFAPTTFDSVLAFFIALAQELGVKERGVELSNRVKAQFMVWCDNFYERMKNKRVTVLASVAPLRLAGFWIPDLVHLASAECQSSRNGKEGPTVAWSDIVAYRPDVLVVAIEGADLAHSMQSFRTLEKLEGWELLPAVKRGEVIFAEGQRLFYRPTPAVVDSMAILISAIAGFESGYITPRDTFFRLRWMELHRDRY